MSSSSGCGGVVWLLWSGHNPARSLGLMDSLFSVTGTPWALIDASLALHLYPAFCERTKRTVKSKSLIVETRKLLCNRLPTRLQQQTPCLHGFA